MNESISRAAGASHGQEMSPEAMVRAIQAIGRTPRPRNTLYGTPPRRAHLRIVRCGRSDGASQPTGRDREPEEAAAPDSSWYRRMTALASDQRSAEASTQAVIRAAVLTYERGLVTGMVGNVSVRHDDEMLITPTRRYYDELLPSDVVAVPVGAFA